jgi:hypothetical protein
MTATTDRHAAAAQYIRRIRNVEKRRYARDWYAHVALDEREPDDRRYDLGYMGKQSVRMELRAILTATAL